MAGDKKNIGTEAAHGDRTNALLSTDPCGQALGRKVTLQLWTGF